MKKAVDYLFDGPAPRKIPEGKVLVHNGVYLGIQPMHEVGAYGFRAWWADGKDSRKLMRCDCAWRPDLGIHYRDDSF